MRIAHVLHPYQPDLGYQENHLPTEQKNIGHEVALFTSSIGSGGRPEYPTGQSESSNVSIYRLDEVYFESIDKAYLKGLGAHLSKYSPDIVHAHNLISPSTLQCLRYEFTSDWDLFVDVHIDNDNFHLDSYTKQAVFTGFKRILLPLLRRRTEAFLPTNRSAERLLSEYLGIPKTQISRLPLGVDTTVFNPQAPDSSLQTSLGYSGEETVIVTAGNLNETKDIDVLLEAFAEIRESYDQIELLVVGDGPDEYMKEIQSIATREDIQEAVTFTGYVPHDELPKYYNIADFGVWPGKLGITIIEAMGCGLPIIVCESPATEFLVANENGITFPRGDIEHLSSTISSYLQNGQRREQHSVRTLEYVSSALSWESIAEQSLELYQQSRAV